MGTNTLTTIGTTTPVLGTGDLVDQYKTAICVDFLPRNASGVPTTLAGSLGSSSIVWNSCFVDNIWIDGNTIVSTNTNGDINITPNGSGSCVISKATIASGTASLSSASITTATITTDNVTTANITTANITNLIPTNINSKPFALLQILGDGSDGSYTSSGGVSLGGIKQYVDFTLQAGHTLTVDSTKKWLILLVQGTLTIAGNISGNSCGGAAGSGAGGIGGAGFGPGGSGGGGAGDAASTYVGYKGGDVTSIISSTRVGGAGGPAINGAGGAGTAGSAASTDEGFYYAFNDLVGYGAGGGVGANGFNSGGAGGGGILIICKNLVITGTPTISSIGGNGSSSGNGGGGGGGGGYICIKYKNLTGVIPTLTVTGGSGGNTGPGGSGGAGYSKSMQLV